MRFEFKNKKLCALYTEEKGAQRYGEEVVVAFFEVMAIIAAANDERDIYAMKGLRFERLIGKRAKTGECSLRLNKQWRLIIELIKDAEGRYVLIIDIEDYH